MNEMIKLERCYLCRKTLSKEDLKIKADEFGDKYCKECLTTRTAWIEEYRRNLATFKKVKA